MLENVYFDCFSQALLALAKIAFNECSDNGILERHHSFNIPKHNRKVRFSNDVIHLIPCRTELFRESSKDLLWYNASTIAYFRRCAFDEAHTLMNSTGIQEIRKAFTYLYQSHAPCGTNANTSTNSYII
jgi:hypothetical protein